MHMHACLRMLVEGITHHAWQVGGLGTDAFPPGEKKPGWQMAQVELPAHPGAHAKHAAADVWLWPSNVLVPFAQRVQLAVGGALPALQVPDGQGAQPAPPVPGGHTVTKGGALCGTSVVVVSCMAYTSTVFWGCGV